MPKRRSVSMCTKMSGVRAAGQEAETAQPVEPFDLRPLRPLVGVTMTWVAAEAFAPDGSQWTRPSRRSGTPDLCALHALDHQPRAFRQSDTARLSTVTCSSIRPSLSFHDRNPWKRRTI
jgi:hypothetical protein